MAVLICSYAALAVEPPANSEFSAPSTLPPFSVLEFIKRIQSNIPMFCDSGTTVGNNYVDEDHVVQIVTSKDGLRFIRHKDAATRKVDYAVAEVGKEPVAVSYGELLEKMKTAAPNMYHEITHDAASDCVQPEHNHQ